MRGDASISPTNTSFPPPPLLPPASEQDKVHGVSVTRLSTVLLTVVSTASHLKHVNDGAAQLDVKLPLPLLSLPTPTPPTLFFFEPPPRPHPLHLQVQSRCSSKENILSSSEY